MGKYTPAPMNIRTIARIAVIKKAVADAKQQDSESRKVQRAFVAGESLRQSVTEFRVRKEREQNVTKQEVIGRLFV